MQFADEGRLGCGAGSCLGDMLWPGTVSGIPGFEQHQTCGEVENVREQQGMASVSLSFVEFRQGGSQGFA